VGRGGTGWKKKSDDDGWVKVTNDSMPDPGGEATRLPTVRGKSNQDGGRLLEMILSHVKGGQNG